MRPTFQWIAGGIQLNDNGVEKSIVALSDLQYDQSIVMLSFPLSVLEKWEDEDQCYVMFLSKISVSRMGSAVLVVKRIDELASLTALQEKYTENTNEMQIQLQIERSH